ncbi:MAG TPA: farnesyl diphosphate synthase [Opitutaceae bacterium]|jgi:geranylgeranyl pyrophosphate synthase
MDPAEDLQRLVARIDAAVPSLLPPPGAPSRRLHEAMLYAMQSGGKRLRPVLVLAAARLRDGGADPVPAAVAVECVHAYSLVHDDLPCMDDDDLRRGRPTVHRAFDEATAVLAGDALLTEAFGLLARSYGSRPALCSALVGELAEAAGSRRLVGGQMEDLLAERGAGAGEETLVYIHLSKTAAMVEASLTMGGLCAGVGDPVLADLRQAGRELGLAFQIVDDVLDATADTATLGKTAGKDARAGKATFVSAHGVDGARRIAAERSEAAAAALRRLPGDTSFLLWLAQSLVTRRR